MEDFLETVCVSATCGTFSLSQSPLDRFEGVSTFDTLEFQKRVLGIIGKSVWDLEGVDQWCVLWLFGRIESACWNAVWRLIEYVLELCGNFISLLTTKLRGLCGNVKIDIYIYI